MAMKEEESKESREQKDVTETKEQQAFVVPLVAEEIIIEELAVDGICGIY